MKKGIVLLVLMGLLGVALGVTAQTQKPMVTAFQEEPDFLDPHRTTRFHSLVVLSYVVEPLLDMDPSFQPVPLLVRSFEWSEDKLTLVFHLKQGILFHTGQEMTSRDVKASYERYFRLSPLENYLGPKYKGITEIQTPDPYTVIFKFATPKPLALYYMADAHASIMPADWLATMPDEEVGVKGLVGTGPYRFDRWIRGDRIVLKRFAAYNHAPDYISNPGPAYAEELVMRIIPEAATRLAEILAGNIDYTFDVPLMGYQQLVANPNLQVYMAPTYSVQYLVCNMKRELFNDRRIRLAIAHAINKEEIVKGAWFGIAFPLYGLVGPGTTGYWKGVEKIAYAYDPEKAIAYLEQAGWTAVDRDGVRMKDGKRLELTLISFSNVDQWRRAAEVVQAQLARVGIKVNLALAEVGATYDRARAADYDLGIFRNTWWMGEPYLTFLTHSVNIGSSNFGQWKNETIDTLLDLSSNALDDVLRRDAFVVAQAIVVESAVWVPLAVNVNVVAARRDVGGLDELFSHPWQPPLMRALVLYKR
ncbi:MAG: ABC transporter substrate-binding protein [Candidatus Oleimicrobiaceae bacterium]